MSAKARSRPDDEGRRGRGSGAADDDDGDSEEAKCKGCGKKVRNTSFSWLKKKSKKLLHQKRKQKGVSVNSGRRVGGGVWWCCLCVKQPRTLDSSGESPTSDPNSKEFTFDMLRALIENNDFYSKECNPHLDADCCERK